SSESVIKININTATVKELMTLPAITEALAGKIIAYREENEDFVNIDEIMQVEGIGEGIFSLISRYITV
ncbi:MAG: helix-hairpin-helix domain-containing protein, partial [Ruminiclostridium sp.]|nr:helix-hairpin-helix domain-containing protein [Ruminiclostridium sp.]